MGEQLPQWTAVIVNYNAGEHLAACVSSLLDGGDTRLSRIIVVDNGSTDGSLDLLVDGTVDLLRSPGNVGYARAANLGIAASNTSYVAVFNPDLVFAAGATAAMASALDAFPRVGAIGPRIRTASGDDYPSARMIPDLATSIGHAVVGLVRPDNRWSRRYRQTDLDPSVARDSDWLSGAAMMLRREALDAVGGWDERFFMFMEDVDLCVRLRAAGWRVRYEPTALVVHLEGVSRRSHPYRTILEHHRSALRYAVLHWRGVRRVLLGPMALGLGVRASVMVAIGFAKARLRN